MRYKGTKAVRNKSKIAKQTRIAVAKQQCQQQANFENIEFGRIDVAFMKNRHHHRS
jgi:hypothetical protein